VEGVEGVCKRRGSGETGGCAGTGFLFICLVIEYLFWFVFFFFLGEGGGYIHNVVDRNYSRLLGKKKTLPPTHTHTHTSFVFRSSAPTQPSPAPFPVKSPPYFLSNLSTMASSDARRLALRILSPPPQR
jgi:hypothetical protein